MTNQSEQAKGLETVEQAAQELFDRGTYKNDSQLQLTYLAGARFGAQWQQSQPSIKQWVSEGDLYRESEVRLIATRFARESRLKHDVTSNDTITTFDAWFKKENFVQAYLPNSTTTPKSDMVSREKVIEIIQNLRNKYKQDQTPLSEKVIQECITKIKEI